MKTPEEIREEVINLLFLAQNKAKQIEIDNLFQSGKVQELVMAHALGHANLVALRGPDAQKMSGEKVEYKATSRSCSTLFRIEKSYRDVIHYYFGFFVGNYLNLYEIYRADTSIIWPYGPHSKGVGVGSGLVKKKGTLVYSIDRGILVENP